MFHTQILDLERNPKIDIMLGYILGLTEILTRNFAKNERNSSGDNL